MFNLHRLPCEKTVSFITNGYSFLVTLGSLSFPWQIFSISLGSNRFQGIGAGILVWDQHFIWIFRSSIIFSAWTGAVFDRYLNVGRTRIHDTSLCLKRCSVIIFFKYIEKYNEMNSLDTCLQVMAGTLLSSYNARQCILFSQTGPLLYIFFEKKTSLEKQMVTPLHDTSIKIQVIWPTICSSNMKHVGNRTRILTGQ